MAAGVQDVFCCVMLGPLGLKSKCRVAFELVIAACLMALLHAGLQRRDMNSKRGLLRAGNL